MTWPTIKDKYRGRSVRLGQLTPEERLHLEQCVNPPTTSEWLAWLRRTGDRTRFWNGKRWMRRPRPFVWPRTSPLATWTTHEIAKLPG